MSLTTKVLYLGFVLIPLLILVPMQKLGLFHEEWVLNGYISSFWWISGVTAIVFAYLMGYVRHLNRNEQAEEKTIWKIGFVLFYFPVMLGYWWRYIRSA
tara:strand:- start:77 stop:373 length:297 start_codon:yes stop_codon:yes gene_type:complete